MRGMSESEGGCHIASATIVTIPSLSPDLSIPIISSLDTPQWPADSSLR